MKIPLATPKIFFITVSLITVQSNEPKSFPKKAKHIKAITTVIEEFSGTKLIAIEQDFYASIYISIVVALINKDTDDAIANDNRHKNLKSESQANRNFILSEVLKKIITMLVKPILGKRILETLLEKAKKIRL